MRSAIAVAVTLAGLASFAQTPAARDVASAVVTADPPAAIAVISDTHMGFGESTAAEWNPLEDFRWSNEFFLFLNEISRQGRGHVTLVLNGDTFELWQSDSDDCRSAAPALGCSEAEVSVRLREFKR